MADSRKDRRERDKLQARVRRRALPLIEDNPLRATIRARFAMRMAEGETHAAVLADAQGEAERASARVFADAGPPACSPGCSHCCERLSVGVEATEARVIASHLRRLPAAEFEAVRAKIAANAARARGTTTTTYPRMTCALLDEDRRCSVYAIRPFVCRRAHAFDADACRRATAGEDVPITVDARVVAICSEIATAFREASVGFGGDRAAYELHQALALLLDDARGDLASAVERTDDEAFKETEATMNAALRAGRG